MAGEAQIRSAPAVVIMLDTHIAVALYDGRTAGLGNKALRAIDRQPVVVSPAVLLELELLHEIGRLRAGAAAIAKDLEAQLAIRIAGERFRDVALEALALGFTRDPFDRLIVAHAALLKAPLVTHDVLLAQHYPAVLQ
ncbi:MAG TPA: PIN domain-containing protein [Rhodanobacteraceae bacterium]|nr:PIN domain-containing protein [Rhodanobacteraceae bacterium]